jgi:small subunit ribosomal protein S17
VTADRGARKVRTGTVVSDRMDKTVVIRVEDQMRHPMYKKIVRRSAKLVAHDEANEAKIGDRVRVSETRPLSKTKRWRVVEIVERAK